MGIPIRVRKNGKVEHRSETEGIKPHRLTRVITQSGNYGLDAAARKLYPELVMQPGEKPTPETIARKQQAHAAAWAARLKPARFVDKVAENVGAGVPEEPVVQNVPAYIGKPWNGYKLFIRISADVDGRKGSLTDLMIIYNSGWTNLTMDQKSWWNKRARDCKPGRIPGRLWCKIRSEAVAMWIVDEKLKT